MTPRPMTPTRATLYESRDGALYMTSDASPAIWHLPDPAPANFEEAAVALLDDEMWQEPLVPPGTVDLASPLVQAVAVYDGAAGRVEVLTDSATGEPLAGPAAQRFLGILPLSPP